MDHVKRSAGFFCRHLYVQDKYKLKMITRFCLLALTGTVLLCVFFYLGLNREIGESYQGALEGMRHVKAVIMKRLILNEASTAALVGAAAAIFALVMSHRLAGPIWRLEQTARAVGAGDRTGHTDQKLGAVGLSSQDLDGLHRAGPAVVRVARGKRDRRLQRRVLVDEAVARDVDRAPPLARRRRRSTIDRR